MELSTLDRNIINHWQGGVPLTARPYAAMAEALGVDEDTVITRLQTLLDNGVLTRFGPLFNIEQVGGCFCLAALAVPETDYERVTALINAFTEVAHNYRREHALNMWFVIATEDAAQIEAVAAAMTRQAGLKVYLFPKQREFFVELKLTV